MDGDLAILRRWWASVVPTAPADLAGLWFGLTDLLVEGRPETTLYVAGCGTFDPTDSTGGWAVSPYRWWPEGRYIALPGLPAAPMKDHPAVLQHAASLIRDLKPQDALGVNGVAVGFDDGDFVITWSRS